MHSIKPSSKYPPVNQIEFCLGKKAICRIESYMQFPLYAVYLS